MQDPARLLFGERIGAGALSAREVAQRVPRDAGLSGSVWSEVMTESRPNTVEYHGIPAEITSSPSTATYSARRSSTARRSVTSNFGTAVLHRLHSRRHARYRSSSSVRAVSSVEWLAPALDTRPSALGTTCHSSRRGVFRSSVKRQRTLWGVIRSGGSANRTTVCNGRPSRPM